MKKRILLSVLSLSLVLSMLGCGGKKTEPVVEETAKEEIVTQEFEFYSDDEYLILYNFPENYEVDGKNYAITTEEVDYETLGTRDTVQTIVEMNVEELEELPDSYTYEAPSGKEYELKNEQVYIQEKGLVKIPVIEEVFYKDVIGKPDVPSKKTITYFDKAAGADKEIEGLLTSYKESEAGHWENLLEIEGTFMAPSADCNEYELGGAPNVKVSRSAPTPVWGGYESQVLSSLGLDSKYYRVTGAFWSGNQYLQDGWIMRNALFTGDMFVATYKATYEAEREAQGYSTKVFYRVDADAVDAAEEDITTVYHIKAVVKYKLVR